MKRVSIFLSGLSAAALLAAPAGAQDTDSQELGSQIPEPISIPGATPSPTPAPSQGSGGLVAIPPARQGGDPNSAVGPDSLRDFSLGGSTPQRRAPTPAPAPAPAPTRTMPTPVPPPSASGATTPAPAPARLDRSNSPVGSVTPVAPPPTPSVIGSRLRGDSSSPLVLPSSPSPDGLTAPDSGFDNWPWLVALLAVLAGGIFAWQRRRPAAVAGGIASGAAAERRAAPQPASSPAPPPQPASPPPAIPGPPAGTITTRLSPDLSIDVEPVRAVFAEEGFTVDYKLTIANRGQGDARMPTIRQDFLFASATQDGDIDDFVARPPGSDDKALPRAIPAGSALSLDARAHLPLEKAQVVVVGDRKLFLPILALAVRHGGQAPAHKPAAHGAWIIGRKGGADGKMAPIRADMGARVIRDLQLKRQ